MKKEPNYLTFIRQYELVIASGAVLLLVLFLVFNMMLPNLNRANQIYVQGQTLSKKFETLKLKDSLLTSLDAAYYKDIFLKLNQVIPESKDYVSLINTFNILEQKAGIRIVRTDFQLGVVSTSSGNLVRAAGSPAYVIPVTIGVEGTIGGIRQFLEAVTKPAGRLMVFDDMSVNVKSSDILEATFNGRAFFYPLPTTLAAIDTALPKLEKSYETILKDVEAVEVPASATVEISKESIGKKNLFQ